MFSLLSLTAAITGYLATAGMTYFMSALDHSEIVRRYVPLMKALADNIAVSVASLRQPE